MVEGARRVVHPLVLSASRREDVPAFRSDWFLRVLREGGCVVNVPRGGQLDVRFDEVRFVVFWSKNPRRLLELGVLDELERRGIDCYVQYTLNDYEDDRRLEPDVPPLSERVETMRRLSARLGVERVLWRFDPLVLTDTYDVDALLRKTCALAERVCGYTRRLTFSYVDVEGYRRVARNLRNAGLYHEVASHPWTEALMLDYAGGLFKANECEGWGLRLMTCAEGRVELGSNVLEGDGAWRIESGRCVDAALIGRLVPDLYECSSAGNRRLFYQSTHSLKPAAGQRRALGCGCAGSTDIGRYACCPHGCGYCYASGNKGIRG